MRFGARIFLRSKEPFNNIIQRARFCEKLGFDSVFIDDHLLYGTSEASAPEPFTTLTALAAETRKIRVGIVVTDLVRRHPAIVAQAMATLATIAPRRVFLGLGAGDPMKTRRGAIDARDAIACATIAGCRRTKSVTTIPTR